MRASTVVSRLLDRCGDDSLGVEISFNLLVLLLPLYGANGKLVIMCFLLSVKTKATDSKRRNTTGHNDFGPNSTLVVVADNTCWWVTPKRTRVQQRGVSPISSK